MKRTAEQGAVLMEVVLALVLFAGAAAVIGGGLSASMKALERVRLNAHAVDLAVSVLSEAQMGIRPAKAGGPEAFEPPFELWTWEMIAVEAEGDDASQLLEVVIRYSEEDYTLRLAQLVPFDDSETDSSEEEAGEESVEAEIGEESPGF